MLLCAVPLRGGSNAITSIETTRALLGGTVAAWPLATRAQQPGL